MGLIVTNCFNSLTGGFIPPFILYNRSSYATLMFNNKLQPIYEGKVLVNQSALENPVVQSVLKEMSLRNFEPLPTPTGGYWSISDRH